MSGVNRPRLTIAGFLPVSLIDWPGQPSAVLFTQGCNLRCPYCHNTQLIPRRSPELRFEVSDILARLKTRRFLVGAVTVSGGEPTLHKGLPELLKELRDLGFSVKLDTNGSRPRVLERLLGQDLLDYVALDAKGVPGDPLDQLVGCRGYSARWQDSLRVLQQWGGAWEARTTVHSRLSPTELSELARYLPSDTPWFWQACLPAGEEPGCRDAAALPDTIRGSVRLRGNWISSAKGQKPALS